MKNGNDIPVDTKAFYFILIFITIIVAKLDKKCYYEVF